MEVRIIKEKNLHQNRMELREGILSASPQEVFLFFQEEAESP